MTGADGSYRGFGLPAVSSRRAIPAHEATALLRSGKAEPRSLLAFGNGRSYGDSCLNDGGTLADMRSQDRILSVDPATGIVEAEAGVLLSDIIAAGAPHGLFPPVVPGTQFVTLGGAIANDIHGKNHHRNGTFGCHVTGFALLRSDGRLRYCTPFMNSELFAATIGGMGLTGIIVSASIRLMRVPSIDVDEKVTPFRSLPEFFEMAPEADAENDYAVAWIDQLATGAQQGRGLLMTGNHAPDGARDASIPAGRLGVPFQPPVNLLNRHFLKGFNAAYHWKKGRGSGTPRRAGYRSFFFPLDGVRDWNRLYGPRGLYQHQSVVPEESARLALPALLEAVRRAGHASFLTVLKRFGASASPGLLSFPRPGYTLTLDFANSGRGTLELLKELDWITIQAGGAVNPYKDARMSEATFAASFPEWRRLEALRDPAFMSDFWRRTAMALEGRSAGYRHAAE